MTEEVEEFCDRCSMCVHAQSGRPLHATMGHLIANGPLEVLAIDCTVLELACGYKNVLVCTDLLS